MAKRFGGFSLSVVLLLVAFIGLASSADPPPSPAPSPPPSPIPEAPNSSPPETESPPPQAPASAPTPGSPPSVQSPPAPTPTPAPNPSDVSDVSHSDMNGDAVDEAGSPGGMSGAKKAGIAAGVIAAFCMAGLALLVYKKRRDNIRRSEYGCAARRQIL